MGLINNLIDSLKSGESKNDFPQHVFTGEPTKSVFGMPVYKLHTLKVGEHAVVPFASTYIVVQAKPDKSYAVIIGKMEYELDEGSSDFIAFPIYYFEEYKIRAEKYWGHALTIKGVD